MLPLLEVSPTQLFFNGSKNVDWKFLLSSGPLVCPRCVLSNCLPWFHLNNYTKWNKVEIVQVASDSQVKRNGLLEVVPTFSQPGAENKSNWSQETACLQNKRCLYASFALFVISVVIHVHIWIKKGVSSVICVRSMRNTVPFLIKCFCPWIKTEVLQGGVSLACVTAFLRFIQSVIVIVVPFWPEFPPYSFTIHSKINEFTWNTAQHIPVSTFSQ